MIVSEEEKGYMQQPQIIAGKKVGKGWLQGTPDIESYRSHLQLSFEKAQCAYKMRQLTKKKGTQDEQKQIAKRMKDIESPQAVTPAILLENKTVEPEFPELHLGEKLKLVKLSRSCQKKTLERFFHLDLKKESLVYYNKAGDMKPKKTVSLEECRVGIESLKQHRNLLLDEQKQQVTRWVEEGQPYRVKISVKAREFQPLYHYTESLHHAINIKAMIDRLYMTEETKITMKNALNTSLSTNKIQNYDKFYSNCMLKLSDNRRKQQQLVNSLQVITNDHYQVEGPNAAKQLLDMLPPLHQEENKEEIVSVKKPPEIWSTFKRGHVHGQEYNFKSFSKIQRLVLGRLVSLAKDRLRHPLIQDLITKRLEQRIFPIAIPASAQYLVHDQIINNLHKLGDLPFMMSDINGGITGVKVDHDNLILIDKKKNEFPIPLTEICYMAASDSNQKQWKLQLRGRKINTNVDLIGENLLPQQIGLERQKYSRLVEKQVIKLSLKKICIPLDIQKKLEMNIANKKDKTLYRLKFEVGEFCCYSTLFQTLQQPNIQLKEDLDIDLHEAKYVKISLVSVKGRTAVASQTILNEITHENVESFVTIKVSDFTSEGAELMHTIPFSKHLYNPKITEKTDFSLNCAIVVKTVNGASDSAEMEGLQLLVGRHAIYKDNLIAKVLKVNRATCRIEILETQPNVPKERIIDNVPLKDHIRMVERYGISVHNLDTQPTQNYTNGQYEWTLNVNFTQKESDLVSKIQEAISNTQVKNIYQQRRVGRLRKAKSQTFVCGRLFLSVMGAQNLESPTMGPQGICDSFVQLSLRDSSKANQNSHFIDIANEDSFIMCQKNSADITVKTLKTSIIPQDNNPQWVSKTQPQGTVFDLGMYMKKYPHFILIEVYNQKKKSMFSSEKENEMIGFAELATEDLLSLENFGQEFYIFLDDSANKNALIKLRTLFVPSVGTIDRLRLDQHKSVFKNTQQFLFHKVLHMTNAFDQYGYQIPTGQYHLSVAHKATLRQLGQQYATRQPLDDSNTSLNDSYMQNRYEKFSPEHQKHLQLRNKNPLRPKIEENLFRFKQLWLFTSYMSRSSALMHRQQHFWEQFINDIMADDFNDDGGQIDDELKSIRSKLTNTTKIMSSKYRKRTKRPAAKTKEESKSIKENDDTEPGRFSALFVGQWEKQDSWKYIDIWYLIKYGIPEDMRGGLWKDLLRRQIHEQQAYVYFKKMREISLQMEMKYRDNLSVYENLKNFSSSSDSVFYQQIEQDIKAFQFPEGYMMNQQSSREDKMEEQRHSIYCILKSFSVWATEFAKRRNKVLVYNSGMIAILQRFLTFMSEPDAFWAFIGIVKGMKNLFSLDNKAEAIADISTYEQHCPYTNRKVCYKNEMLIINCIIKIHYPEVYNHLKSLSMPIEWYFYESFSTFYSNVFSSDLVLRLWDMIVLNLSTSNYDQRKRAFWYLLAVPIYMIQVNNDVILQTQNPITIKSILHESTAAYNYNPNLFVEELLTIIKKTFVKNEELLNRIFKNAAPDQLEAMRIETELEFLYDHKEGQDQSKRIAKHMLEKDVTLNLRNVPKQPILERVTLSIEVVSMRLHSDQYANQYQIIVKGDEVINTGLFTLVKANQQVVSYMSSAMKIEIPLRNQVQQKQIELQLFNIEKGIHQNIIGSGLIKIEDFLYSPLEQKTALKLYNKDFHASSGSASVIDLCITATPTIPSGMVVMGALKPDKDFFISNIDEITRKKLDNQSYATIAEQEEHLLESLKECVRRSCPGEHEYTNMGQITHIESIARAITIMNPNQAMSQASKIIESFTQIVRSLGLDDEAHTNLTHQMLKIMCHGQNIPSAQLLKQILSMHGPLNVNDTSKIIHHLLHVCNYPLPMNEVYQLVNMTVLEEYTFITSVTQQSAEDRTTSGGMFSKIFGTSGDQVPIFDVTQAFRATLNAVIRLTGLCSFIDFNVSPFNSIDFWLGSSNNLGRSSQILTVTLQDRNGDLIPYHFKFHSQENQGKLPLKQYAGSIGESMKEIPMISNVIAQDIFLRHQINGSQEVYVESPKPIEVAFTHLKTQFKIRFTSQIERSDDFTVDSNQNLGVTIRNINRFYRKTIEGGITKIDVTISPLSRQDTFITIKQRVWNALTQISQNENIADLPNVMSGKFKFRSATQQHFDSMDRIMNVIGQHEQSFELERVQQQQTSVEEEYSSFALYTHLSGVKEWRRCKILLRVGPMRGSITAADDECFKIEFLHERDSTGRQTHSHLYNREDVLLSFDYKRTQDDYYKVEVKELLEKLDQEEVEISELIKDQDHHIKRLNFGEADDGLRINNGLLQDVDPEDQAELNEIEEMSMNSN